MKWKQSNIRHGIEKQECNATNNRCQWSIRNTWRQLQLSIVSSWWHLLRKWNKMWLMGRESTRQRVSSREKLFPNSMLTLTECPKCFRKISDWSCSTTSFILVEFQHIDNDSTERIVAIVECQSKWRRVVQISRWKTKDVERTLRKLNLKNLKESQKHGFPTGKKDIWSLPWSSG